MTEAHPLFDWLNRRSAGLLLHPVSLPGRYGVGSLGAAAYRLVDFMHAARMSYWQILPLNPTGYGDSPYSSFSAFAGNPYLIDLQPLLAFGLLGADDLAELDHLPTVRVDYGALYTIKWPILRLAYKRFHEQEHAELPGYGSFDQFKAANARWLDSFALFMALKAHHGGAPWYEWEPALRTWATARDQSLPAEVLEAAEAHRFYQYLFFSQWSQLRAYANKRGISIIGDVPIFVSRDSADVWTEPQVFQLDADLNPPFVAGVPPDYFSPDGQLWGNPLYDWDYLKSTGYEWWLHRLAANYALLDVVRLDHFRGFAAYWAVQAGAENARKGTWEQGPGLDFFRAVQARFPHARMIAEDLGEIDQPVYDLVDATGLPGMTVLQFAFDGDPKNVHLPHNMRPNQVLYPGTHDNDTTRGWYEAAGPKVQDQFRRYLRVSGLDAAWDVIRECYHSVPRLTVIPAQDLLNLGPVARMNTPGVAAGNWQWRMTQQQFEQLTRHTPYLREIAWLYNRVPDEEPESLLE